MATTVMMAPAVDRNDNKYKCCCNCCHVETGSIVIGTLEALGCMSCVTYGLADGFVFWPLMYTAVTLVILVFFFVGLYKQNSGFLIPHMFFQVGSLVMLGVGAVVIFALFVSGAASLGSGMSSRRSSDIANFMGMMVGVLIALLITVALEVWFATIVHACYKYYKALEQQQQSAREMASVAEQNRRNPDSSPQPPPYPGKAVV